MQSIKTHLNLNIDASNDFNYKKNLPFKTKNKSSETAKYQAENYISLIKDPLWKHVCMEIVNIMGSDAFLKMQDSQLGPLSPQDKTINLYCQTEEVSDFIQQYDFIILGSLQRFFPSVEKIKVKNKGIPYYL